MANALNATPPVWVIDTPSATPVSQDWLAIDSIVWDAGATSVAGDECKVTDASGAIVLFDKFSTGADFETYQVKFPKSFRVKGLTIPTLAHGKVTIYLK